MGAFGVGGAWEYLLGDGTGEACEVDILASGLRGCFLHGASSVRGSFHIAPHPCNRAAEVVPTDRVLQAPQARTLRLRHAVRDEVIPQ